MKQLKVLLSYSKTVQKKTTKTPHQKNCTGHQAQYLWADNINSKIFTMAHKICHCLGQTHILCAHQDLKLKRCMTRYDKPYDRRETLSKIRLLQVQAKAKAAWLIDISQRLCCTDCTYHHHSHHAVIAVINVYVSLVARVSNTPAKTVFVLRSLLLCVCKNYPCQGNRILFWLRVWQKFIKIDIVVD